MKLKRLWYVDRKFLLNHFFWLCVCVWFILIRNSIMKSNFPKLKINPFKLKIKYITRVATSPGFSELSPGSGFYYDFFVSKIEYSDWRVYLVYHVRNRNFFLFTCFYFILKLLSLFFICIVTTLWSLELYLICRNVSFEFVILYK